MRVATNMGIIEESEPSFEWLYSEAKRTKDVKGMWVVASIANMRDRYREIYDTAVAWQDWSTAASVLARMTIDEDPE